MDIKRPVESQIKSKMFNILGYIWPTLPALISILYMSGYIKIAKELWLYSLKNGQYSMFFQAIFVARKFLHFNPWLHSQTRLEQLAAGPQ